MYFKGAEVIISVSMITAFGTMLFTLFRLPFTLNELIGEAKASFEINVGTANTGICVANDRYLQKSMTVPPPIATIDGKAGGDIALARLKLMPGVIAEMKDFDFPVQYTITKFDMS